eukprot:10291659-Alexandrium_andersonii.AAC.1
MADEHAEQDIRGIIDQSNEFLQSTDYLEDLQTATAMTSTKTTKGKAKAKRKSAAKSMAAVVKNEEQHGELDDEAD